MRVYIDTSAFLAVLNPRDLFHAAARESWMALLEGEATLVCSNYVLLETIALVQRRMGLEAVRAFVENVLPVVQVVWVSEADHEAGLQGLLAFGHRRVSLVDCVSFVQMRRLGLECVFCFDPHFTEQGFECVPKTGS
jgi:predicted nucleic acid-binding protein